MSFPAVGDLTSDALFLGVASFCLISRFGEKKFNELLHGLAIRARRSLCIP